MSLLQAVPPEVLALLPLSLAAGIDLYLTLLLLGTAHASGLWPELPGSLADMDSPGVIPVLAGFWLLELLAERYALSAALWNIFHALVRPLAGALLAVLLLDGHPPGVVAAGAAASAALTMGTHLVRTGGSVLLWLHVLPVNRWIIVSALEDAVALTLVFLALDHLVWGILLSMTLVVAGLLMARAQLRAFRFVVRLAWGRFRRLVGQSRWTPGGSLPRWVQDAVANDPFAPAGALRGCPAAADRLVEDALFDIGWMVIRGGSPAFVHGGPRRLSVVDLGAFTLSGISEGPLARALRMEHRERTASLHIPRDGPSVEGLEATLQGE